MKVADRIKTSEPYPDTLFAAEDEQGNEYALCRVTFMFDHSHDYMLDWNVTRPKITPEEAKQINEKMPFKTSVTLRSQLDSTLETPMTEAQWIELQRVMQSLVSCDAFTQRVALKDFMSVHGLKDKPHIHR